MPPADLTRIHVKPNLSQKIPNLPYICSHRNCGFTTTAIPESVMPDPYLTIKSLHVVFMVAWFAGLFYMPRIFIYQTEARSLPETQGSAVIAQLKIMARRLWYIITWPAAIATVVFGVTLLVLRPHLLHLPWMHVKLGFVGLLLIYHLSLHVLYRRLTADRYPWSSMQLRFYNEVATILLFAIIFTVIFKTSGSWAYGVGGILALGFLLSIGILVYRRLR